MTWLHTWCGLVFGWILFAIFFSGTIAVFRHEIDYWMAPELHVGPLAAPFELAEKALGEIAPTSPRWTIEPPTKRMPTLRIRWQPPERGRLQSRFLDAEGRIVTPRATSGGSMIYRFHYGLLLGQTGRWIVGGLGMAMLVGLVTGIVIHAKIFSEFFTFRAARAPPRAWRDAHSVIAVLSLPFCLMITYSGLVIWWFIWMPGGLQLAYSGDRGAFFREMSPPGFAVARPRAAPAPMRPLHEIIASARSAPPASLDIGGVTIVGPGREGAVVDVARTTRDALWGVADRLRFRAEDGAFVGRLEETGAPANATYRVTRILHEIKFAGPWLRWLFFLMGLASCAVIATGAVLWGVSRRARHAREFARAPPGPAAVLRAYGIEMLNAGVIAGLCVATCCYGLANRLLPAGLEGRAELEVWVFFLSWLGCAIASVGFAALSWRRFRDEPSARRGIRVLWAALWGTASGLALLLLAVDQVVLGGITGALARQDRIVLAVDATILAAALGLILAALVSARTPRPRRSR